MRCFVIAAGLMLACGDNIGARAPELVPAAELVVVAHAADELLLMQPDVVEAVEREVGVTTVYLEEVTADQRAGLRAAYGDGAWACGELRLEGHDVEHCRRAAINVSLLFAGGANVFVLARIVRETQPAIVRTLEVTGTHGPDDDAHRAAGTLTVSALALIGSSPELLAYRGDSIAAEPPNKLTPIFDASLAMLSRYEPLDQNHVDLLLRRYAIGFRRRGGGKLRSGNQCVTRELTLTSCPAAATWVLDSAGELRAGDRCLALDSANTLTTTLCVGGIDRRWFADDEGHLIAGQNLGCLAHGMDALKLAPCNTASGPQWELVPDMVITPRANLGFVATGRDVRLGDLTGDGKADLCTFEGGLVCAPGTGSGAFLPATRIDDPSSPLAIEPRSLMLGDVDGDRRIDACGLDVGGIVCATAATGFEPRRWTPAFAEGSTRMTTAASLTASDANADGIDEICGVDTMGVLCAARGDGLARSRRTMSVAEDATVWIADLDGDREADWCASTEGGPACAVWAQRELTMEGAPWSYARDGDVDVVPATTATVALADIDGDGRADLCRLRDDRVVCTRSQGRAFGPRMTLALLPNQSTGSALWLGDLDGDGRADPCVDTGTSITCAVQP